MTYITHSLKPYYRTPVPGFGFELIECQSSGSKIGHYASTSDIYDDLARSGVVIYRGFEDSLLEFNDLVGAHSARVTFDPARPAATPNTAEINAGQFEMGLHRENGNLPFSPDIQWFYCLRPASAGSETTMCDGTRVLQDMSAESRKRFETHQIRFARRIPWQNIQRFLSIELAIPLDQVDDTHLEFVNATVPGQVYRRLDDRLIHSELTTSAITISRFSGRRAFCNSLLGPSVNYEPPRITWANGEDISFDVWDEIKALTSRHTYDLFWQDKDIVLIDNTRVMHGRRRVRDPARRIFGAQSYRKEAIAP